MCTVSFYKDQDKIIITSNRDEHISRPHAIAPTEYIYNGTKLFFPKDPMGGGSWFVVNESGNVYVLLNGADKKHILEYPYRKSRGIILLEIALDSDIYEAWYNIDLDKIEPFTTVCFCNDTLYQCQWNGTKKTMIELESNQPHIWSSTTLYSIEIIAKREIWFSNFLATKSNVLNAEDLISFHTGTHLEDSENGLIINRNEQLLTKNVTQFLCTGNNKKKLLHFDLLLNTKKELTISV